MKCLVRIPLDPWVVKFFIWKNRTRLQSDGITIEQTAKDTIGKLLTSYMQKTIFDMWYMANREEPHLRIVIPAVHFRNGLTKGDLKALSSILKDIAQDQLCLMLMSYGSLPGVSREKVIRGLWEMIGLTDDDYDMEHFRRYFDRYGYNSTGTDFLSFQKEVSKVLKPKFDQQFVG